MPTRRFARDTIEFARGLAFFDAIYAVAITLLIVDVEPPTAEEWQSVEALVGSGMLPQLLAFTISFLVIANFWRINHRIMADLVAIDGAVLNANIAAMFFIVVLPFSTSALTEEGVDELPLPVAVYAVNIVLASLAQSAIWSLARRRGYATTSRSQRAGVGIYAAPAIFALSIPVAYLVSAQAARYTWLLLLIAGPVEGAIIRRRVGKQEASTTDAPPG